MKKNPNLCSNGDNQIMYYKDGKFHNVPDQQFITTPNHRNFLIVCEYGDWSPFLTMKEVKERIALLERDYPIGKKPNFFFRVVERL